MKDHETNFVSKCRKLITKNLEQNRDSLVDFLVKEYENDQAVETTLIVKPVWKEIVKFVLLIGKESSRIIAKTILQFSHKQYHILNCNRRKLVWK